ncbi:MAG: D-tyrosyl-tRNA(Tyr) deacylase [Sphingobacteriales bacterium]|nr:MAG: D-tyrosyl-tRNA(Tyr) deacylase [Sphingobacteriales bacterium]
MRAIIQRVSSCSVTIDEKIFSSIEKGLLVLIGIEDEDNDEDISWLSQKISQLRIFSDENNLMNLSVKDIDGEILVVSQFTLHASTKKGNRPSFIRAAKPDIAIPLYEKFLHQLKKDFGKEIKTGIFGADMKINLVNDGPVTIFIDTKNRE